MVPTARVAAIEKEKASIRKNMIRLRRSLDDAALKDKSREITARLVSLKEFERSRNCLFYLSLEREVQTEDLVLKALEMGKAVHVPLVDHKARRLKISKIPSLEIAFEANSFGVREPCKQFWDLVSPGDIDFIVTPGLAFDPKGGRIGYGVGYYDRLLEQLSPDAVCVAMAFDFQVLDAVPQDEFDVPVQKIITEKNTIDC